MNLLDTLEALTPEAFNALERAEVSRRQFIKASGALIVGFSIVGPPARAKPIHWATQRLDGAGNNRLDGWIAISADGTVTAYTGKCELGQGLYTAQTQLIAEELSVGLDRVK